MDCKYDISITKDLWVKYCDILIGQFYKIIPIYEGVDFKSKKILYNVEEAYEQYKKYIDNFIIEMQGGYYLFSKNEYFFKLLSYIESMSQLKINEHKKLKSIVFSCINIIKKMKEA